jgi:hypothetical protein
MRQTIFIKAIFLLALLFIFLHSCKKEETYEGKSSVVLSGTPIELDIRSKLYGNDRFHFYIEYNNKESGRIRFESVINGVPAQLGTHTINPTTTLTTLDNDKAYDEYMLLESEENTVTLTKIDTVSQVVHGTFQASYIYYTLFWPVKQDIFPDTIRFTDGKFEVPYEKK